MSSDLSDLAPEDEAEYQDRRQALMEDAAQTKQELEAEQAQALAAIRSGGDLEEYETVELGELELEVKAWVPGSVAHTIRRARRLSQAEDLDTMLESMETMLSALDEISRSDTYNMAFWREYYDEWGPEGVFLAVDTLLDPAFENKESAEEAVESFPADEQG